jgi:hypothetical protein
MNVFKQIRNAKRKQREEGIIPYKNKLPSKSQSKVVSKTPNKTSITKKTQEHYGVSQMTTDMHALNMFDPEVKLKEQKPGVFIGKNENTGVTTIAGAIKDKNNPEMVDLHVYNVRTKKAEEPDFSIGKINSGQSLMKKNQNTQLMSPEEQMQRNLFVDTIKKNKLTKGTIAMMNNEKEHAQEAIESGIYITWTSKTVRIK